jgi:hypothetical protein
MRLRRNKPRKSKKWAMSGKEMLGDLRLSLIAPLAVAEQVEPEVSLIPGAFISIFNAVNQFADLKTVDLVATSSKIRAQRNSAMERSWQFRFCYETIIEFARSLLKLSNVFDLDELLRF